MSNHIDTFINLKGSLRPGLLENTDYFDNYTKPLL